MALNTPTAATLHFATFEVDLRAGELRKQGKRIKLQEQPFRVLSVLLRSPGELVTREELRSEIWPQDTFVDFDNGLNAAVNKVRDALGDCAESPRFIETLPRRGYRFIVPVTASDGSGKAAGTHTFRLNWKISSAVAAAFVICVTSAAALYLRWKKPPLTAKDSVVLADFVNTTGDSVFDDALKHGLRAHLEQSPFLNLLSDEQVSEGLRLMARHPGERLTADLGRQLCLRVGSKAVLNGSIASLGTHYVINLTAANCQTGATLVSEQAEATDKEHVLASLGGSATKLRRRLGESLASIQNYDVPLEQVTTSSLEALRAYSLGMRHVSAFNYKEALPHFQRAVELDPNFASAHMRVANTIQVGGGPIPLMNESLARAYELREKVSRREYFQIITRHFYDQQDLEQVRSELELWAEAYPRDAEARYLLADSAMWMGNREDAVRQGQLAVELNPNDNRNYYNLAVSELALNRIEAAKKTTDQAIARHPNDGRNHFVRYWIAFLREDLNGMANEEKVIEQGARQIPNLGIYLRLAQIATELHSGKVARARDIFKPMTDRFIRSGNDQAFVVFYTYWTLWNTELGNNAEARAYALRTANVRKSVRDGFMLKTLAAARAGDISVAEKWIAELEHYPPLNWYLHKHDLPVIRAILAVRKGHSADAVVDLRLTDREAGWYENDPISCDGMMPTYLLGQAYLRLRQGKEAAAAFQRLIDHPGIVVNSPFGPLARVGLARSYALQGDVVRARAAYQDFLTLWKDADTDIPIFQQAKVEYARLN